MSWHEEDMERMELDLSLPSEEDETFDFSNIPTITNRKCIIKKGK